MSKLLLLSSLGPVAQLVERLICTEEAAGSNPVWSTKKTASTLCLLFYLPLDARRFYQMLNELGKLKANCCSCFRKE